MIGLAQGPGPCVSSHVDIASSSLFVNIVLSKLSSSALLLKENRNITLSVLSNFISHSFNNKRDSDVLKFVGPLKAAAPISLSAWIQ